MDILNSTYLFFFILSTLNILRTSFFLFRSIKAEEKFMMGKTPLFLLGISISYFITSLITVLIN